MAKQYFACFGDLHGAATELVLGLSVLERWSEARSVSPKIVFLGDYIDRGNNPNGVLDIVMRKVSEGAVALLGNHDDMLVKSGDGEMIAFDTGDTRDALTLWGVNEGVMTYAQMYGKAIDFETAAPDELELARETIRRSWQYKFVKSLPSHHSEFDQIFFCHAPQSKPSWTTETLLWGRAGDYVPNKRFMPPGSFQMSVHGHIARQIGRDEKGGRAGTFPDIRQYVHGGLTRTVAMCDVWTGRPGAACKPVIISYDDDARVAEVEAVL